MKKVVKGSLGASRNKLNENHKDEGIQKRRFWLNFIVIKNHVWNSVVDWIDPLAVSTDQFPFNDVCLFCPKCEDSVKQKSYFKEHFVHFSQEILLFKDFWGKTWEVFVAQLLHGKEMVNEKIQGKRNPKHMDLPLRVWNFPALRVVFTETREYSSALRSNLVKSLLVLSALNSPGMISDFLTRMSKGKLSLVHDFTLHPSMLRVISLILCFSQGKGLKSSKTKLY